VKWWYQSLSSQQKLFASLKERSDLHNLKFEGETSSTDYESAESFTSVLRKLNEENGYLLELCLLLMRQELSGNGFHFTC
jgi:hypothetical protein